MQRSPCGGGKGLTGQGPERKNPNIGYAPNPCGPQLKRPLFESSGTCDIPSSASCPEGVLARPAFRRLHGDPYRDFCDFIRVVGVAEQVDGELREFLEFLLSTLVLKIFMLKTFMAGKDQTAGIRMSFIVIIL